MTQNKIRFLSVSSVARLFMRACKRSTLTSKLRQHFTEFFLGDVCARKVGRRINLFFTASRLLDQRAQLFEITLGHLLDRVASMNVFAVRPVESQLASGY